MPQALTKRERGALRKRMLQLRCELMGDSDAMAREALIGDSKSDNGNLSTVPQHMADRGSDAFEQEFTLGRLENANEIIAQIDEALERMEAGAYGICEGCGQSIAPRRLRIRPYASLCVTCKQNQETESA